MMPMGPDAIRVEDLWKRFRIPHERRNTILEGLAAILGGRPLSYEELWALRGVSFSLGEGESLGIIGPNGSGKSTLLKIMARILRPDRGRVEVRGKIAPILELGVGFHPDLTVRENVLVYGSIMGLRSSEIKGRMGSILRFAGLERFGDARLKNLSSGMQMRLGFSVAIETDPDIFLVDEALAVGDAEFQAKCLDKFKQFRAEGRTIVLVSHALGLIREFCDKGLLLIDGGVAAFGDAGAVVEEYARRLRGG